MCIRDRDEVRGLLEDGQRLQQEYQRRLQKPAKENMDLQAKQAQITKIRQGMARLIDSYSEGFIQKSEFEPRITRLRQRLADLETQAKQMVDEMTLQEELHLVIHRLEDFAAQVREGLDEADGGDQVQQDVPGWEVWTGVVPGGETADLVRARVGRVIERAEASGVDRVLCFAHAHVLRALTLVWLDLDFGHGEAFPLDTATISVLGDSHGRRALLRWNAPPPPTPTPLDHDHR